MSVTYLRGDPGLPPVGVVERRQPSLLARVLLVAVALLGAAAWSVIAAQRSEPVNAVWFVLAAIASYLVAYRCYAKFIERNVVRPRDENATPAELFEDGRDFVPTDRRVLFGHHFAAIAGAGPLVGPVLAAQMGYLPCTLWIVIGVVFAGAVQDYLVLAFSARRRGRSLGQLAREELGPVGGAAALVAVLAIMLLLTAVLAMIVVNALAESPWGVFSIAMTLPIALLMGVWLRYIRPGKVGEATAIGVALLLVAVAGGGWVADTPWGSHAFALSKTTIALAIVVYGFLASALPVWLLLAPRDYLSSFMKVSVISLLAVAVLLARPATQMPAITAFATSCTGPVFAGTLFPFLFITIACGALSGFHALVSSGTTPKLLEKEGQARLIGYGSMLLESFVAIMALLSAVILDPHLYFVMNAPVAVTKGTAEAAANWVNSLGLPGAPLPSAAIGDAASAVGEHSVVSRAGGAPTLALGMSHVLNVFGGSALAGFWYHFAIMFEALFILTTVDAGTRVARFMLSDTLGNVRGLGKLKDPSWRPGSLACSFAVAAGWGSLLLMGVTDPLGGINTLYPLFGVANQLLAAVALTVVTMILVRTGLARWAWVTLVPLAWDLTVTLAASWQKIFSANPDIGYWAQHRRYAAAQARGANSFGSAKTPAQIEAVVRNTAVQAALSVLLAVLVLVVVLTAAWVAWRTLRGFPALVEEEPAVPSRIFAPRGLFPTKTERAVAQEWATTGAPGRSALPRVSETAQRCC
ncbi:carbon starvation protein CstA [Segniliparus rotundus DSM 44985]|uniref:Carbon starvation protein CstA n=1 Tax=Segniliparus rotundus (strain ATCC BAA-972 / CDC 1076 / CIP 108378 / DSM 44985 / JCM 13578) TaxID=640132 RepID=D6Z9X1_SEGRD|nr:carbon starvation CstA family protein [Segniliparus rotundus]ADG98641.1 carbon starvation protein CstA [Segniliparus rotundus DSM 44985]